MDGNQDQLKHLIAGLDAKALVARHNLERCQIAAREAAEAAKKAQEDFEAIFTARRVVLQLLGSEMELRNALMHSKSLCEAAQANSHRCDRDLDMADILTGVKHRLKTAALATNLSSRQQKEQIIEICMNVLADGQPRSTEELLAEVSKTGLHLSAANPTQRVSQILSGDERFVAQRGRGWSLAPLRGLPDDDRWEEELKLQARRALNNDNSAR